MDMSAACMSWLLWVVLLWTVGCMYLFQLEFSSFLNICPGVALLDHMVALLLVFFKETPDYFPQWPHQFTFSQQCRKLPILSHPHQCFIMCGHFGGGHSEHLRWYFMVVWKICFWRNDSAPKLWKSPVYIDCADHLSVERCLVLPKKKLFSLVPRLLQNDTFPLPRRLYFCQLSIIPIMFGYLLSHFCPPSQIWGTTGPSRPC